MVGALAGAVAPNVFLAPVLGAGSHVLLDMPPHYDFDRVGHEVALGALALALILLSGLANTKIILGALFGALPDLENLLWKWKIIPDNGKVFPSHSGLIPHGGYAGPANLIYQTALSGLSLILVALIG